MKKLTIAFFGWLTGALMMRSMLYTPSIAGLSRPYLFAAIACTSIVVSTQPQYNPWQHAGYFFKKALTAMFAGCSGYMAGIGLYYNFSLGFPNNSLDSICACALTSILLTILFLRIRTPYGYEDISPLEWFDGWVHRTFIAPDR